MFGLKTHRKIKETKADDTYAVDFDAPIGTDIYSVSSGIISAIQSDSKKGGNNPIFIGKDNYIYIYSLEEKRIFCYRHYLHFVIYEIQNNKYYSLKSMPIVFSED